MPLWADGVVGGDRAFLFQSKIRNPKSKIEIPLAIEQRTGVTLARVQQIAEEILHS